MDFCEAKIRERMKTKLENLPTCMVLGLDVDDEKNLTPLPILKFWWVFDDDT